MKKTFSIVMLLVYTVITAGMTIIVHTCGGVSETLIVTASVQDPCADGNEMPMEDMCCTTEIKTVKIDDEQKVIAAPITEKLVVLENLLPPQFSTEQIHDSGITFQFTAYVSPPPNTDITIVNSVFLI